VTEYERLEAQLVSVLKEKFGDDAGAMMIPPPVFRAMQAQVVDLDLTAGLLSVRFPVLHEQLNPFGNMQGGMVAAMIDNTLGPLSMAVAPPNFTRHFEIKYRRPVHPDMGHVLVTGSLVRREKRRLYLVAKVTDDGGNELAVAKSVHWIFE
jgi:acyl-coenzyme A thioesterase PaaI-like protein